MNKEEMRKLIWGKCLLLTTEKRTQFNKGKRSAYEELWNELGGDIQTSEGQTKLLEVKRG